MNDMETGIQAAYKKYLGRTATPQEIATHSNNPGGFPGVVNTIANSPEAYAFANTPANVTSVGSPNVTSAGSPNTDPPSKPDWLTSNATVNLPGWDSTRIDNDPKMVWGRYVQSKGGHVTGDDVRAFVTADPRWEIDPRSSPNDPHIRVKQDELNKWKGGTSTWQDVIRDAGGANVGQFLNADADQPSQSGPTGRWNDPGGQNTNWGTLVPPTRDDYLPRLPPGLTLPTLQGPTLDQSANYWQQRSQESSALLSQLLQRIMAQAGGPR